MSLAAAMAVCEERPPFDGLPAPATPRLVDAVRSAMRLRHVSRRTERAYLGWIRRFVLANGRRPPREMGAAEVTAFLSALATERRVAASTPNQALAALLFHYRDVQGQDLPWLDDVVHSAAALRGRSLQRSAGGVAQLVGASGSRQRACGASPRMAQPVTQVAYRSGRMLRGTREVEVRRTGPDSCLIY